MSRRPTRGLLFFVALIIAVGAAGTLSACGKKGDPELREGREDGYPRKYPSGPPPR